MSRSACYHLPKQNRDEVLLLFFHLSAALSFFFPSRLSSLLLHFRTGKAVRIAQTPFEEYLISMKRHTGMTKLDTAPVLQVASANEHHY